MLLGANVKNIQLQKLFSCRWVKAPEVLGLMEVSKEDRRLHYYDKVLGQSCGDW